jgi:hypothetical protein
VADDVVPWTVRAVLQSVLMLNVADVAVTVVLVAIEIDLLRRNPYS